MRRLSHFLSVAVVVVVGLGAEVDGVVAVVVVVVVGSKWFVAVAGVVLLL